MQIWYLLHHFRNKVTKKQDIVNKVQIGCAWLIDD